MILNTILIQSTHTEGTQPPDKSLYDIAAICPAKTGKDGKILAIELNPQLKYIDFYSQKEYVVYHSEIKYHVVTDGELTIRELYTVFEKGMNSCIKTYQLAHQHLNNRSDKMFEPIPFEALEDKLQQVVDWFLEK